MGGRRSGRRVRAEDGTPCIQPGAGMWTRPGMPFAHFIELQILDDTRYLVIIAVMGIGLHASIQLHTVRADESNDKETCASQYPNAPTKAPAGYDYKDETNAFMALRRKALGADFVAIKKGKRDAVTSGPCVDHGEHVNMWGRREKGKWDNIGALTSCKICQDTPRGPKLRQIVWRIHTKF